jgi:hypothetical protein
MKHLIHLLLAFLAVAAWAVELPETGTAERPVVLLAFGAAPLVAPGADPAVTVFTGTAIKGAGAESALLSKDAAVVRHKGFGAWEATFRFALTRPVPPGTYRFYARYHSGGEVSQVKQRFTVFAGPDADHLGVRGVFETTNRTPFTYQWLAGAGTLRLFPGDTLISIANAGKAHDSKSFSAFLLALDAPAPAWLTAEDAALRNTFLQRLATPAAPEHRLYVLDGPGATPLFTGLVDPALAPWLATASATYLWGVEAEGLAARLNIARLPAAIVTDALYGTQGVLTAPATADAVAPFLRRPTGAPLPPPVAAVPPAPLRDGVPTAWLIGGLHDGRAGNDVYGVDVDAGLRPNPGQPYLAVRVGPNKLLAWEPQPAAANGLCVITPRLERPCGWSRGTGYAALYLRAEKATTTRLHWQSSGVASTLWVDGRPMAFTADPAPPTDFPKPGQRPGVPLTGQTVEGLTVTALPEKAESPRVAELRLTPGWHRLLVKTTMQLDKGESFYFAARFTPAEGLTATVTDPEADLTLNAAATGLRPLVYVDAPANLPRPGEPLRVRVDMRWHPLYEEPARREPLPAFSARLRVTLREYAGTVLAVRETDEHFPGVATLDFGTAPAVGYYTLTPELLAPDTGAFIARFPADGFTVVPGNAAQRARLDTKKVWDNNYYLFINDDSGRGFQQPGDLFAWLERSGVWQNMGGNAGAANAAAKWAEADARGIVLVADSGGDSPWLNATPEAFHTFAEEAVKHARLFKCVNEIDIRGDAGFAKMRDPQAWVARMAREHALLHALRPDALYIGGSLVRPGVFTGADRYPGGLTSGAWFAACLQLGLDAHQDAWDVHDYPQVAPRLGGPFGNASGEGERGVLAAYAAAGRTNTLPFFEGETGAYALHGDTGRRWQADTVAKMVAWANARPDYLGIAFCIAHEYDWGYGRVWPYSMGHKPGESALITAGALIDGRPCRDVAVDDAAVQAATRGRVTAQSAWFGDTFMIWTLDGTADYRMTPPTPGPWVLVDVVGTVRPQRAAADGTLSFPIGPSPCYVLPAASYAALTRLK